MGRWQMPILKRHHVLITVEGVRERMVKNQTFTCRYDLVGFANDGRPRYICVYLFEGKEHILISSKVTAAGIKPKILAVWPGLFKHHFEFGDGTKICFSSDYTITTGKTQGGIELEQPDS
jgi:hypothetical protein